MKNNFYLIYHTRHNDFCFVETPWSVEALNHNGFKAIEKFNTKKEAKKACSIIKNSIKTSSDWYDMIRDFNIGLIIMDPDGWDRKNYQYSFNEELISYQEFNIRVGQSTCIYQNTKNIKLSDNDLSILLTEIFTNDTMNDNLDVLKEAAKRWQEHVNIIEDK